MQAFAGYHLHCFEAWLALPNKLSTTENKNGGGFHRQNVTDSDYVAAFLQSMEAIAKHNLPFLREQCHLTGRVLDVGAGPSTFCRDLAARQRSEVTGLDLPAVVHAAKRHFEFPSNYKWVACDFEEFMPTEFFDAVFCSHLLEYCPPDSLHQWLGKLRSFLNPSGATAFVIFLKPDERSSIDLDLFELSTGVNGSQLGHIWSIQEFRKTLSDAGAVNLRCIPIPEGASYSEYLVLAEWRGEENTR